MIQPQAGVGEVLTVVAFLAAMLALLWWVRAKAPGLRHRFRLDGRMRHVESLTLPGRAALSLIEVDGRQMLVLHGAGAAALAELEPAADGVTPVAGTTP